MSSSLPIRSVLLACLVVAVACAEPRYKVRLDSAGIDGAAAYEIVVLRVSCAQLVEAGGITEPGWVVGYWEGRPLRVQWRAGTTPPDLGQVEPGRYAVVGIVRDAGCGAGWGGCTDEIFERGGDDTIVVPLQPVGGFGCLPGEICAGEGLCGPAPQCDNVSIACDGDGDGHAACLPEQAQPCDCRDDIGEVFPGAEEHCDGFDNDCNGEDDPPECAACIDSCPELAACERPSCPDGPEGQCVPAARADGFPCEGEAGAIACCGGECTGACDPGGEPEERACGACGTQTRTCGRDCQWGDWSICDESGVSECDPLDTRTDQPCGMCGTQDEICSETCEWEPDGACTGQGVCAAGTIVDPAPCGACGMRVETCLDDCTWELGPCELDPEAPADACTLPDVCCPDGSCGDDGAECCGTDVSTCPVPGPCEDATCAAGVCDTVFEADNTDPEDECGANCCDGAGGCAPCA